MKGIKSELIAIKTISKFFWIFVLLLFWNDGTTLTIQDGNYDGVTNTFEDAKADWKTVTYSLDEFRQRMKGVVFANPI